MPEQLILRCEDSLDGILTALFDAFVYKNRMERYEDQISIAIGEGGSLSLFADEVSVKTNWEKAQKTVYAIQNKLGYSVYHTVFYALCHFDEERGSVVLGYLVRAFATGSRIREYLADPYVMRVMELSRKVGNECQKLYGFLRFRQTGEVLYAEAEPKCDALPVMMEHFSDRYPNEHFIIYDKKREYALVHPRYGECFFVSGVALPEQLAADEDEFEILWKQYFQSMEITERKNERCQNTLLPKWYRKTMLEFRS